MINIPLCVKCKNFLPPTFMKQVSNTESLCVFCERDILILTNKKGESFSKTDIVKQYDIFMKMVKEKNEILKKSFDGDISDVPSKIL